MMAESNSQETPSQSISIPLPIPSDPSYIYPSSILTTPTSLFQSKDFQIIIPHYALIIPKTQTATLRKLLSKLLLDRPKMKDVYELNKEDVIEDGSIDPSMERKLVLNEVVSEKEKDVNEENNNEEESIYEHELIKTLLSSNKNSQSNTIRKAKHNVVITYNHLTVEQTLQKLLPPSLHHSIPSSFEIIGNIAHFNLRPEYLPYKFIIGRIILDKNKSIQVCVNKIGSIQNEFRTFPMEIIADDRKNSKNKKDNGGNSSSEEKKPKLEVELKEDGCKFKLDFEKVYWNSRLQHEHRRIVHLISGKERLTNLQQRKRKKRKCGTEQVEDEQENNGRQQLHEKSTSEKMSSMTNKKKEIVVVDACAGIGPFAIPLTCPSNRFSNDDQTITVYANDLNPASYKYLNINAKINKCLKNLHTYNMDGRDFIRKMDNQGIAYDHVIMNLPAIAPEFLNVFRGWKMNDKTYVGRNRPMVHIHCFGGKDENAKMEAIQRCSKALGCLLDEEKDEVKVYIVRDVSPRKNMLCVAFRIPMDVKDLERVEKFDHIVVEDDDEYDGEEKEEEKEPPLKKSRSNI